jgi:hypothetical protein
MVGVVKVEPEVPVQQPLPAEPVYDDSFVPEMVCEEEVVSGKDFSAYVQIQTSSSAVAGFSSQEFADCAPEAVKARPFQR